MKNIGYFVLTAALAVTTLMQADCGCRKKRPTIAPESKMYQIDCGCKKKPLPVKVKDTQAPLA